MFFFSPPPQPAGLARGSVEKGASTKKEELTAASNGEEQPGISLSLYHMHELAKARWSRIFLIWVFSQISLHFLAIFSIMQSIDFLPSSKQSVHSVKSVCRVLRSIKTG